MHSPEQILALLRNALTNVPEMDTSKPMTDEVMRWFGRTGAVIELVDLTFAAQFRAASNRVGMSSYSRKNALQALLNAFYKQELMVPAEHTGVFIPAGDAWNGYAALLKPVQTEADRIMIVDPYISESIFTDLMPHVAAKRSVFILTTLQKKLHEPLLASFNKWLATHPKPLPTVEVRYAAPADLHDRLIILDSKDTWLLSQTIKDIGVKSAASVTKADPDLGALKGQHYDDLWTRCKIIG